MITSLAKNASLEYFFKEEHFSYPNRNEARFDISSKAYAPLYIIDACVVYHHGSAVYNNNPPPLRFDDMQRLSALMIYTYSRDVMY